MVSREGRAFLERDLERWIRHTMASNAINAITMESTSRLVNDAVAMMAEDKYYQYLSMDERSDLMRDVFRKILDEQVLGRDKKK